MPFKRARVLRERQAMSLVSFLLEFQCPLSGQGYCGGSKSQDVVNELKRVSMPFKRARVLRVVLSEHVRSCCLCVSMPFKRARVLRDGKPEHYHVRTNGVSMPFKRARVLRGGVSQTP